jgi:hypothetical protein
MQKVKVVVTLCHSRGRPALSEVEWAGIHYYVSGFRLKAGMTKKNFLM